MALGLDDMAGESKPKVEVNWKAGIDATTIQSIKALSYQIGEAPMRTVREITLFAVCKLLRQTPGEILAEYSTAVQELSIKQRESYAKDIEMRKANMKAFYDRILEELPKAGLVPYIGGLACESWKKPCEHKRSPGAEPCTAVLDASKFIAQQIVQSDSEIEEKGWLEQDEGRYVNGMQKYKTSLIKWLKGMKEFTIGCPECKRSHFVTIEPKV